jgi:hypothetical protein
MAPVAEVAAAIDRVLNVVPASQSSPKPSPKEAGPLLGPE